MDDRTSPLAQAVVTQTSVSGLVAKAGPTLLSQTFPLEQGARSERQGAIGDTDERRTATFSYGTLLATWRKTDPRAAAPALDRLVARLVERAADLERRSEVMAALGNAADPGTLPALQRELASPEPRVRAAALVALRSMNAPGVDQAIRTAMRTDAVASVRGAAIYSATFRDPAPYAEDLVQLALREPDALARNAAVTLLARTTRTWPRAQETLAIVAKSDPRPDIRKLARKPLADTKAPLPPG